MERRRNEKRQGGRDEERGVSGTGRSLERNGSSRMMERGVARRNLERGVGGRMAEEEEDYGDYVTRCICEFKHDDGYMICCDDCSVWQHVECMQVDPKNLPENYLCELCEPRPVDKRRAQKVQMKKREEISDADDSNKRRGLRSPLSRLPLVGANEGGRKRSSSGPPSASSTPGVQGGSGGKKRKKRGKLSIPDPKLDSAKKTRRDKALDPVSGGVAPGQGKKQRRLPPGKEVGHMTPSSSIQSLLTAASLLDEDGGERGEGEWHQLWDSDRSPWIEDYETILENLYSDPVRVFLQSNLSDLKSEAVVYTREEYLTSMHHPQHTQCRLVEVAPHRRGLVAQEHIPQDELVMECKGEISVKQDLLNDLSISSESSALWQHKPCPFVYIYDKISNLDLCIDSTKYGNLTRFIRRSCSPNAEVRHFFVSSDLHFGVYALNHITPDEELTLPFDFDYEKCDYPVECGCGQRNNACLVAYDKDRRKSAGGVSMGGVATKEDILDSQNVTPTLHQSHSHVFLSHDEDSNTSWISTASTSRKRTRLHPTSPRKSHGGSHASTGSSDSEEETIKKSRKVSLSREERKTEQVWRVFEKLEASAQRKRQHLQSEGSHDSDPLTSPLSFHPPLAGVGGVRGHHHRLSSTSSQKANMLGGAIMRLSSVSSPDPLSPSCDHPEAFSPPMTPGIAHLPDMQSPLLSPSTPTLHFQATPQLHPKYLFADFALPWKKAILKQWESEQLVGHAPVPRSYWVSKMPLYGYHITEEMMRPRVRGCLKHRWLKHYNDTTSTDSKDHVTGSDSHVTPSDPNKENRDERPNYLSHKKQVLMRWQGSKVSEEATLPSSKESSNHTSPSSLLGKPGGVAGGGCDSPLFEEFSDSEEFMDQKPTQEVGGDSIAESASLAGDQADLAAGDHTPLSPGPGPNLSEATSPPPSSTSCDGIVERIRSHDSPAEIEGVADEEGANLSGISNISTDSVSEPHPLFCSGPQTPPTNSAGVSDISSDNMECATSPVSPSNTETGKPPSSEASLEVAPTVEIKDTPTVDIIGAGGRPPPLDYLGGPNVPPLSPSSGQATPTKTPGKRKINLSEYRNRARKPTDRKISCDRASSPPPPSTPGTPSFLTHSLFSSYTTSFQLPVGGATSPAHMETGGCGQQFEPVSPEEGDHTPKYITPVGEADAALPSISVAPPSTIVTPSGGVGVATNLVYAPSPGYNIYAGLQQVPMSGGVVPGGVVTGGVVPGYVMEGGGGRWVLSDPPQAHDPRRIPGAAVGVPISASGLIPIPGSVSNLPMGIIQQQPQAQSPGNLYSVAQQQGGGGGGYYPVQQLPPQGGGPHYRPPHPGGGPNQGGGKYY